eukprot:g4334.t1
MKIFSRCAKLATISNEDAEEYLYCGPRSVRHVSARKSTEPFVVSCQTPPSRERLESEDDVAPRDGSYASSWSPGGSAENLPVNGEDEAVWHKRRLRSRTLSSLFFSSSCLKTYTKSQRGAEDDVMELKIRDRCFDNKEDDESLLKRLYISRASVIGPLPISNPNQLLPHRHQGFIFALPRKTGTLTDEQYGFYRNFDGLWRSDTTNSDDTKKVFEMFNCPEAMQSELQKVRNLKIQVKKSGINTCAKAGEILTVDETRFWHEKKNKVKRRDGRSGEAEGWVEHYPQGIVLWSRWTEPHAATMFEFMELTADYMHLCTRMEIIADNGESFQARIVWHRLLL